MVKGVLIFLIAFMVINSGHLLPQKDFVKKNTPENIERLKNLKQDDLAELYSGQTEGDMVLSPEQKAGLFGGRGGKTGLIDDIYRWTDNIVPYTIEDGYFTTAQKNYITLGVQRLMDVTCLKFVPYDPAIHTNYIYITGEDTGCWSMVGRQGGAQPLNLQPFDFEVGCFRLYTIVHEFLHAIGFFHMQSATDRDDYVKIVWENIITEMAYNFDKYEADVVSQYGIGYDYGSVMHYPRTAFTNNGEDTIIPLNDLGDQVMGQRVRMSEKDIARVNAKYCPRNDTRPRNLFEFFARMNEKMNKLFQTIF